jgi:ferredoxin
MQLGIFLCTCNNTIDIDFKNVKKSLKKEVEVVETLDHLCQDGLDYIIDDVRRFELDTILIAACTEKNRIFESVTHGCDTFFLNLREHCGWVHEKKEATEKAKNMIRAAIDYLTIKPSLPKPKKISVDVKHNVLVVGDEDTGAMDVAKRLSQFANVHLLTNGIQEWCDDFEVHIGSLKGIRGDIGDFEVEIEKNIDVVKCISCGLCAEICPKDAIRYDGVYTIGESCDECGECIKVCPTGAIEFHNKEVIRVGQVLVIAKEGLGSALFGVYIANPEDALSKALDIVSNLGEIEKKVYLDLDLERCASGRSELNGCEVCLPCPYEAIWREGVKMKFSEVRCQGCGLCSSLCPLSVPQLHEYPNQLMFSQLESLLLGSLDPKVLLFVCSEHAEHLNAIGRKKMKYPALLPLFVPCIDGVSETHLLSAFALGADGVILWGCENSHREQVESVVTFTQMALSAYNLGERVLLISDAQCEPHDFTKLTADFVTKLSPSPLRSKKQETIDFDKPKRDLLLDLMQTLHDKTKVSPTLKEENTQYPFADIAIDSKCTFCDACVNLCPINALSKDVNKINFVYANCIACGLCAQACPEEAIDMNRVLDFSQLVKTEGKTLIEAEFVACVECGELFMPKSAFERISSALEEGTGEGEFTIEERLDLLRYCKKCRPVKSVELALKKLEDK